MPDAPEHSGLVQLTRQHWLALGPDRSITDLADETQIDEATLRTWRRNFGWDDAARAYDADRKKADQATDLERKARMWSQLQLVHLKTAADLRALVVAYFKDRQIEGVPNPNGRGWAVKGMDKDKLSLALKMLAQAEATERAVLAPIEEKMLAQSEKNDLTPEQITRQMILALQEAEQFRAERNLPAIDQPNPLGAYAV